jgi:hypothetical protein
MLLGIHTPAAAAAAAAEAAAGFPKKKFKRSFSARCDPAGFLLQAMYDCIVRCSGSVWTGFPGELLHQLSSCEIAQPNSLLC